MSLVFIYLRRRRNAKDNGNTGDKETFAQSGKEVVEYRNNPIYSEGKNNLHMGSVYQNPLYDSSTEPNSSGNHELGTTHYDVPASGWRHTISSKQNNSDPEKDNVDMTHEIPFIRPDVNKNRQEHRRSFMNPLYNEVEGEEVAMVNLPGMETTDEEV